MKLVGKLNYGKRLNLRRQILSIIKILIDLFEGLFKFNLET